MACVTLITLAMSAAPAGAAALPAMAWSRPQVLDASLAAHQPRVALTADGTLLVAWTRAGHVLTAQVPPGGQPQDQELWSGDPSAAAQVVLSAAPDGHALVAWMAGGRLHAASRSPGQQFSILAVPGGERASYPATAIDDAGQTALVWQRRETGHAFGPILISRCGPSASCTPPRVLAARGFQPAVGVDGAGTATVAWSAAPTGRQVDVVQVPTRRAPGKVQAIAGGGSVSGVHAQVAPDGSAVLAWGADDSGGNRTGRAAYRPAGGRFSASVRLIGDLVGFAPIISAPVAGRWWTTFSSGAGNPLAYYAQARRVAANVGSGSVDQPIDTLGLTGDRQGQALMGIETDNSIQALFAEPNGRASPLSTVGPTAGLSPSVEASPQGAIGGGEAALAWLERPAYDPLDVVKTRSGQVVVATAALPAP